LKFIIQGDQKKTINQLRNLINEGLNPTNFLNDLLEIIHFVLQKKELNDPNTDLPLSESENEIIDLISKEVDTKTLIIFWQFIFKGLDELTIVSNQILLLEMLVIRLLHLRDMPSYESILEVLQKNNEETDEKIVDKNIKTKNLNESNEKNKTSKDQIKTTTQTKLDANFLKEKSTQKIDTFEDLINLSSQKKEIELKYDLERNVNLVKFSQGKIDISFNERLGKNFVRKLSEKLLEWTGKRWVISLTKEIGEKSFIEKKIKTDNESLEGEKQSKIYEKFKNLFPDGELINVDNDKE